jgi:hypothetical protein
VRFGGGGPARRLGRRARVVGGTAALPLAAGRSCSSRRSAAPARPRSGPIWVSSGLGRASWRGAAATRPWRRAWCGGGYWVAAALRPACCSVAAETSRASLGLLCPRCRVRSATARLAVEAVPSRTAVAVLLPALLPHRSASRPCADDHRATTRLTQDRGGACSWAAS